MPLFLAFFEDKHLSDIDKIRIGNIVFFGNILSFHIKHIRDFVERVVRLHDIDIARIILLIFRSAVTGDGRIVNIVCKQKNLIVYVALNGINSLA